MTDIHYTFFLLCMGLAALWLVLRPDQPKRAAGAAGICAGLACSVKVSGIAVGGLVFLLVEVGSMMAHKLTRRQGILALGLFLLAAVVVVYLLNPFLWPSLANFQGSALLDELRSFAAQSKRVGMLIDGIPPDRYPQLARLARPVGFPLMFPRWSQFMDSQASIAGWQGRSRWIEVSQALLNNLSSVPLLWVGLLAGVGTGVGRLWKSYRRRAISPLNVPLAFFLANCAILLLFLELNWPRYYLPALAGAVLLAGIGISAAVSCLLARTKTWMTSRRALPSA